jgi:hypothetical protein
MAMIDVEALRAQVRAMDYVRGTAEEVAQWREDNENSRANLVIEGMTPTPDEDAMFAMLLDEGVPPTLVTRIILRFYTPATIAA